MPGERNGVSCGSIEEKMGIHGNSTCVLHYDGATGWLVGEAEKGLAAMFIKVNAARRGVGLQARKSVVSGKSGLVRVDIGGGGVVQKKNEERMDKRVGKYH